MKDQTSRLEILRISEKSAERKRDLVVRERPVTIFLNDVDLVTLMCTPKDLEYLAVGFLFAEGLVSTKKEIKGLRVDRKDGVVWVETRGGMKVEESIAARRRITSGCGKGLSFVDAVRDERRYKATSKLKISTDGVRALMREFQLKSVVYRSTGGVHSAGLCDRHGILVFNEDIGRHSAIDKLIGECVLRDIRTDSLIMVTSGRISSEILVKAASCRTPIIVSKSAPTDLAVKLARDLGITLIGFARGSRMNVYTHPWRISSALRKKIDE